MPDEQHNDDRRTDMFDAVVDATEPTPHEKIVAGYAANDAARAAETDEKRRDER